MPECIAAMGTAFGEFSKGDAPNPPRCRYQARHPDPARRYLANVHAGAIPSLGVACVRAGSQIIKPPSATNTRRVYENPRPFNWGIIILFDTATAEPLALMQEFGLSGLRVGATSAMAVNHIVPAEAATLSLFGTGKHAAAAFDAVRCVRDIEKVMVFSPNRQHLEDFVTRKAAEAKDVTVVAAASPGDVVKGVDIVCCCTTALEPVFDGNLLEPGQLVISIANSDATNPKRSEVDETTFARADHIVINDWQSVYENDQREMLQPMEKGLVAKERVTELGDLVNGAAVVRAGGDSLVYYKNNSGLAIQFAAAGRIVYDRVLAAGTAKTIPTEWLGSDLGELYAAGFRPSP